MFVKSRTRRDSSSQDVENNVKEKGNDTVKERMEEAIASFQGSMDEVETVFSILMNR